MRKSDISFKKMDKWHIAHIKMIKIISYYRNVNKSTKSNQIRSDQLLSRVRSL